MPSPDTSAHRGFGTIWCEVCGAYVRDSSHELKPGHEKPIEPLDLPDTNAHCEPRTPRDNPFRQAARTVIELHRALLEKLARS